MQEDVKSIMAQMPLNGRLRFAASAMAAAINGEEVPGTSYFANWNDKPHRVVHDAVDLITEAADRLDAILAEIMFRRGAAEAYERSCNCCPDSHADRKEGEASLADELLEFITDLDNCGDS